MKSKTFWTYLGIPLIVIIIGLVFLTRYQEKKYQQEFAEERAKIAFETSEAAETAVNVTRDMVAYVITDTELHEINESLRKANASLDRSIATLTEYNEKNSH